MTLLVGLFVGGRGQRMGGEAKGLLHAPGTSETLLDRLTHEAHAALPDAECVLVGRHAEYAHVALPCIADVQPESGPLAGLIALFKEAHTRGHAEVIALACDMPYLSRASIALLASHAQQADAVAPKRHGVWEPLVARYRAAACLPLAERRLTDGQRSLQGLLNQLGAACHVVGLPDGELRDWDTVEDMRADDAGGPERES